MLLYDVHKVEMLTLGLTQSHVVVTNTYGLGVSVSGSVSFGKQLVGPVDSAGTHAAFSWFREVRKLQLRVQQPKRVDLTSQALRNCLVPQLSFVFL